MNQSVITWMQVGDSFESQNGTLYFVNVKLEDGTEGAAFSKSERPPYAVGQLVEYEVSGQFKNGSNKLRVKVPKDNPGAPYTGPRASGGGGSSSGPAKKSGYNPDGARVGMAINCAVQLACHGKISTGAIPKWAGSLMKLASDLEAGVGTSEAVQAPPAPPQPPQEPAEQTELPPNMEPVQQVAPPQPVVPPPVEDDDDIPF